MGKMSTKQVTQSSSNYYSKTEIILSITYYVLIITHIIIQMHC